MDANIKEALRLLGLIAMQIADEEWPEAEDSARLLVEELRQMANEEGQL